MTAKAVAAIHRAGTGRHEQRAAFVFVQHAARDTGGIVADGILDETRCVDQFLAHREHLPQQRIVRIAIAHARDEPTRHTHRETGIAFGQ